MPYDPAWDMPQLHWIQQGSFEPGSIPPIVEPTAGTQVWLGPVAQEWLPWICGALDQLRNPSSWIVADDAHMYDTLRRVDTLMGLLCNGGSATPVMLQFTAGCELQFSTDGGATWTTVPGWDANFGNCVKSNLPPPVPPNPNGTTQPQHACNMAGYLASELLEKAIVHAITKAQTQAELANFAHDMIVEYAIQWPFVVDIINALNGLFQEYIIGSISNFTDASTDPQLWSEVTCAIYRAIHADGQVTVGNYPAIVTNVCAVPYVHADVVSAICSYITAIGASNMIQAQALGALDVVDCTNCGNWCREFDFTASNGGWDVPGGLPYGTYVPSSGWHSTNNGGNQQLDVEFNLGASFTITNICVFMASANANSTGNPRLMEVASPGPVIHQLNFPNTALAGVQELCAEFGVVYGALNVTYFLFQWLGDGATVDVLSKIRVYGQGTVPSWGTPCGA